ncbi:MAG: type II toxin-antitoxin system VapC family toxin [Rhodospirillaceae bacterium]
MNGLDWLLDTNLVIGLLKQYPPAVALAERKGLSLDRAAVSPITRMELLGYPQLTADEEAGIRAFLKPCRVIAIDDQIELAAIRLRRTGSCKLPDAIIAATALVYHLDLLTLDHRLLGLLEQKVPSDA